jgi:hypothetical protein
MEIGDTLKKMMGMVENIPVKSTAFEATIKGKVGDKLVGYSQDAATMEPGGTGWQDRQDAVRHMLAVGDMARNTHPLVAKVLSTLHEWVLDAGASTEDTGMDLHNNELALSLFNAKDYAEVKDRVSKLMEKVQFQDTTDKTKPTINVLNAE